MKQEQAETLAVQALGWIAASDDLMPVFMGATGISIDDIRARCPTLEILLVGRIFGAEEALQKGLVNRVVADHAVEEETYAMVRRIVEGAPLVARWHKKFARRLLDPAPLSEEEYAEGLACIESEDYRIGIRAFLEKKTPNFEGR